MAGYIAGIFAFGTPAGGRSGSIGGYDMSGSFAS